MARSDGRPRSRGRSRRDTPRRIAELFTACLKRAHNDVYLLSSFPPGRFLIAGISPAPPALTFAPISARRRPTMAAGSLAAMMARRTRP